MKILIFFNEEYDDSEIDEKDWLKALSNNPVYNFLKNSDEDVYTFVNGVN